MSIENKVNEALGEASMCWSETPKGVFESSRCLEISKKLVLGINEIHNMQLAAISTASIGYFKDCHDDYKTVALSDTNRLYKKYDYLFKLCREKDILTEEVLSNLASIE